MGEHFFGIGYLGALLHPAARAMNGLEGKTALVTGGAGGIGAMICETLVRNGCRVFLHDLPTSDGAAKARAFCDRFGADCAIFAPGDLSDLSALKRESEALVATAGGFDFLVNNAAIDPVAPIEAYSLEAFLAVQTINAHAAFLLCQTLVPSMKRKGFGAIVNMMSITLSGGWAEKVPYVMSKGALLGLTRSLARELGPDNIRVNAVSPGAIPTELERKHWGGDRGAFDRQVIERQSLPFRSDIQDVADAVVYLLSTESRFVTGHELHVNGG
jgi:NAD(P)-dependent dehydrogenase (short-subunit alcohol dehydrogenase family)